MVPGLEAPRVREQPEVFDLRPWSETEDPVALVAGLVGPAATVAIGDRTWARFVVDLQQELPRARFERAAGVVGPLRAVKDAAEVGRAAPGRRRRPTGSRRQLQSGDIPLVGRTEAEVSADLGRRLVAEGHRPGQLRHRRRPARTRPARTTTPATG